MDESKLEALGAVVAEADAMGGPTPEQAEQASAAELAETQAREWGVIAYTIGSALGMLAPELRQVYTEDACLGWGRSVVPVAEKYGCAGPSNVPELGLAIATMGLAVPSFLAVRHRLAAMRQAREAEEAQQQLAQARGTEGAVSGGAP